MNLAVITVVVAVVVVVLFATDRISTHRNLQRREALKEWEVWETPEQARRIRNMSLDHGDEIARLRRAFLIFALGVTAIGSWAIMTIQDTSADAKDAVERTCQSTTNLLRVQSADLTDQIRQRQVRRDSTADEIIQLTEIASTRADQPTLVDVPGFPELDPEVQAYATALAEAGATQQAANDQANIADAQRRLTVYDEDLARLRAQVDDVRALVAENEKLCPRT